jgi:pimeloyl-ACP methyl ester carboxylesterase
VVIFGYIGIAIGALVGAFVVYLLLVAVVPGFSVPAQPLETSEQSTGEKRGTPLVPRRDISLRVKGTAVSAWLYLPESQSGPIPCIVMAHGLGGTKDAGLEPYAARFCDVGFAVLAFDYRHFGASDGEPRQLAWIPYQLADYTAAVEYAHGLEQIDPERIALWGTSLSGGHVIVTAARDLRIACVVAQCPWLDGRAAAIEGMKQAGIGQLFRLVPHAQRDLVRSFLGLSPHVIPLVGRPGTVAVMPMAEAWDALEELAPRDFVNQACARILIRMDKYRPVTQAGKVRCPVLLQMCDNDVRDPEHFVAETEKRLGALAEVIHYPIAHFDIYSDDGFEQGVRDQLAFFRKHLERAR